jgi:hypothetical protein
MDHEPRRLGLKWKIGGIFTAVMLILGAVAATAVYRLTEAALRDQLDRRAGAIATNLSDAAAAHLAAKNLLALHALARKYTLLDGVAYAYIVDSQGEIAAQTLGTFPEELRQRSAPATRQMQRRELTLAGKTVYETSMPVLGRSRARRDPPRPHSYSCHHRDHSDSRRAALVSGGALDCPPDRRSA